MRTLNRIITLINILLASAMVAWVFGLLWFLHQVPKTPLPQEKPADAIVILTGGSLRVNEGIDLLMASAGKRLLISGVGEKVQMEHILKHYPLTLSGEMRGRIDLGHAAQDTVGNAEETAAWVAAHQIHSLILVTADYHLPRALLEFHEQLPGVMIEPHPVFPAPQSERPREYYRLIIQEYHKYLYRWWVYHRPAEGAA